MIRFGDWYERINAKCRGQRESGNMLTVHIPASTGPALPMDFSVDICRHSDKVSDIDVRYTASLKEFSVLPRHNFFLASKITDL